MKTLDIPREHRVLTDDEVVDIVKNTSRRYRYISDFLALGDDAFSERYVRFNDHELPPPNSNFYSEDIPQLSSNLYYIIEMRECKVLYNQLMRRYEQIKQSAYVNPKDKSLRGRYLSKTNIGGRI